MSLPHAPQVADVGPIHDPDFWLQDLRLGRYGELAKNIDDPVYRAERVATWFRTKRILAYVAERLGLRNDGAVSDLQAQLVESGPALLPYLAVAAFAPHKLPVAILDAATAILSPEDLTASQDGRGQHDRLLLLLRILDAQPAALAHVRGLHIWHRSGGAALTLGSRAPHRKVGFVDFLTRDQIERAVASVRLPRGVPSVRYEMTVPRPGGDVIVVLSRNLRRAHHWSDDGRQLSHGHDEELIVLHFSDQGRRVRVSAKTAELPRQIAEAIAGGWFEEPCSYQDDLAPAEPASLQRMVAALVTRQVAGLRLVELAVRSAPLAGAPELVIRAPSSDGDITAAIHDFEQRVGPVLDRLEDVLHLKVMFDGRRVEVDFPSVGGRPIARFADGRLDRHAAEAFREFVGREFGLPLHSMEARCV